MVEKNKYYYTGIFVICSILILILFLSFSGLFKKFEKSLYAESYFQGSIAGLSVGSPVKLNGVPIGKVTNIQFIPAAYPKLQQKWKDSQAFASIVVFMEIKADDIPGPNDQKGFDKMVKSLVLKGLQAQISPDGLTGNSYISLNFDSSSNHQGGIIISWKPRYAYIPSVQSSLEYFSDSIESISDTLKKVNFVKLTNEIEQAVTSLKKMSNNLNDLIGEIKLNPSMLIFTQPPKPIYQER